MAKVAARSWYIARSLWYRTKRNSLFQYSVRVDVQPFLSFVVVVVVYQLVICIGYVLRHTRTKLQPHDDDRDIVGRSPLQRLRH